MKSPDHSHSPNIDRLIKGTLNEVNAGKLTIDAVERQHAAEFGKKVGSIETAITTALQRFPKFSQQDVSKLAHDIAQADELKHLDDKQLGDVILNAFHTASKEQRFDGVTDLFHRSQVTVDHIVGSADKLMGVVGNHVAALDPSRVEALKERARAAKPVKPAKSSRTAKPEVTAPRANNHESQHLESSHKVNAAIWGIGALMSAFSVVEASKYAFVNDDQGQAHVQWSQVGVAGLQLLLAAGCAFMGMQALQGRAV